jgi:hypothetical protein
MEKRGTAFHSCHRVFTRVETLDRSVRNRKNIHANTFQVPANASPLRTFHRFPDLPPETRVNIWKQALSDIDCKAIRVIINFDLDHPGAIISSPRYAENLSDLDEEDSDYNSDFGSTGEATAQRQGPIPAMLHVCRESRDIALSRYRLDLYSSIPGENTTWWNPQEDTVYLPSFEYAYIKWEILRTSLFSVQHLALPLKWELLNGFAYQFSMNSLYEWFLHLPYLKTLSLLVDPFGIYDAEGGRIVQYEPYDVPITRLNNYTPSQIEKLITENIKLSKSPGVPPSVEVLVMEFRKSKTSKRDSSAVIA